MIRFASLAFVLFLSLPAFAQTSFPMITHSTPTALQRGKSVEVTVEGQMNFRGAYKVLVAGPGVTAEVVKPKDPPKPADPKAMAPATKSAKLKVTVAADAPLGVREFRIATELGLSSLGQWIVVDDPVVLEAANPTTLAKPQAVPVPGVVCGRIEIAENVDYYSFKAKAGQVLTFEVHCARIQDKIHDLQKHADPLIRIFEPSGKELASADDDFFADPVLAFAVPHDGEYVVEIRDAKYDGDPRWVYALAITDRPYASLAFPLALNPGQTSWMEPVGSAKLSLGKSSVTAPSLPGIHSVPLTVSNRGTNPVPLVVTTVPLVREVEPNDSPKQATRLSVPGGANARIAAPRDFDHFAFTAAKGKVVRLEVFARRFGTPLCSRVDAMLEVLNAAGAVIGSNDDANGKDPMLLFSPPADGEYVARVRDLNNKGGEGYIYYLEADFARPDFSLKVDPSKAMIGPGSRTAWYVQVIRQNGFEGPIKIDVNGLPKGVGVNALTIPANMTQGCLVLSTAAGAKLDASEVVVTGTAGTETRVATPVEEIYMPGGGRGRFDAGMQAVGITGPSDLLEVQVSTNKIVLQPGQETTINVTLKRRADYDKTVTLDVLLRHLNTQYANPLPPGVTMLDNKSKTLLGTANAGTIVLKAAPDAAECTDVPICVQGYVPVNFVVKVGYASEPILLSVKK